nr:MAG TPA: hypothetical protein [Caudoviricetes sp.]
MHNKKLLDNVVLVIYYHLVNNTYYRINQKGEKWKKKTDKLLETSVN